jgi:hypothetical protein
MMWRLWSLALGEKASKHSKEADKIAVIRTIIFATYLITNIFIVYGVVRTHIFPATPKSVKCIIDRK